MCPLLVGFLFITRSNEGFTEGNQDYRFKSQGVAPAVLESDSKVSVTQSVNYWHFKPAKDSQTATLVYCPGSQVEPTAYAPLARGLAEKGYPVFIVKMGSTYTSLEAQKDDGVAKIKNIVSSQKGVNIVVGGHSLGGAISALYAYQNPSLLRGLYLCATTHPRDFDLSGLSIPVTKISASNDGVALLSQSERNRTKLPKQTKWIIVNGGNHAQFAWYGSQPGDNSAVTTAERQQSQAQEALLELLDAVSKSKT